MVKNTPADAGHTRDTGSIPLVRKISWSRKWQYAPVFLPEKFHGQKTLMPATHLAHGEIPPVRGKASHPVGQSLGNKASYHRDRADKPQT